MISVGAFFVLGYHFKQPNKLGFGIHPNQANKDKGDTAHHGRALNQPFARHA